MMHKILGRIASVRSFVFAAFALAMSAASAFDTPYLTFRSASSFTLSATKRWDGTLQKATGNPASEASWSEWTGASITAVESGGQYYIYLRGSNNTIINGNNYNGWTLTGSDIHCEGDIETLRGYDGNVPAMGAYCYQYLFNNQSALVSAPFLSATTLAERCYYNMFQNCTSLAVVQDFPLATLAKSCCSGMFKGCSALTTPPALPSTSSAESCYSYMFQNCISLTSLPDLPATTTGTSSYFYMFDGCSSLVVNSGGEGVEWSLPVMVSEGTIYNWYMFSNTGGDFTGNPVAGTTYYVASALPPGLSVVAGAGELAAYTGANVNFNLAETIRGGETPYAFSGTVPTGLTLNPNGMLSGAVATAGSYPFTLRVTDATSPDALTLDAEYTLVVTDPDPLAAQSNLGKAKVGKVVNIDLAETISGGVPPYTFAVTASATLPTGFSLTDGVLSGTATTAGTLTFAITATDVLGTTLPASYTIEAVESAGFTDDDPEEPASGVTVDCLTPDGVYPRTCNQVANSSTAVIWDNSWYYVTGNVTLSAGVIVSNKVSLVLGDGATLTVQAPMYNAGINVTVGNSLTVYSQSAGSGTLTVTAGMYGAGIGGSQNEIGGTVNIYGGVISAQGGSRGAGIGGGRYGNGGTLTVGGGTVTATGGFSGAGIGGGESGDGGTVTVNDGTVNATGGFYSAGIGAGQNGNGGAVTINGGTVNATGYDGTPGIGAYNTSSQGTLTVGANVEVKAGSSSTLTDADIQNPNGETSISLATMYRYYAFRVIGPTPLAQTTSALAAYTGEVAAFDLAETVGGGTAPYTFALKEGESLPAGFTLSDAILTNDAASVGGTFVMTVTDSGSPAQVANFTYTLTVSAPEPLAATQTDLGSVVKGAAFAANLNTRVSGGIPPYTFALAQGSSMPDGLSFDNGAISGAPTVAGSHSFTVSVTDSASLAQVANFTYTLYVKDVYSITYKDREGTGNLSLMPSTYVEGTGVANLPTPTMAGWVFVSWHYDSNLLDTPVTSIPASATGDKVLYSKWEENLSGTVPVTFLDVDGSSRTENCVVIDSTTTTLNSGWYVVANDITFSSKTLTVAGDVKIVLRDGKTMTIIGASNKAGVSVASGYSLSIYGQSAGTGTLNTKGDWYGAGIGGDKNVNCGTVTINGGTIIATAGKDGAGIGGGLDAAGGIVVINGGEVTVASNNDGAGIGGGKNGDGGTLTVNGGSVSVHGYQYGSTSPGIGGGVGSARHGKLYVGEYVSVMAGNRSTQMTERTSDANGEIALAGEIFFAFVSSRPVSVAYRDVDGTDKTTNCVVLSSGAQILSDGWYAATKDLSLPSGLTVSGDVKLILSDGVTLTAGNGANLVSGIGVTAGNSLTIYGQAEGSGTLNATGGDMRAGIGGGNREAGGTVTINGGIVNATSDSGGAGIGGGNGGGGGAVTINGGTVTATGGGSGCAGIGNGVSSSSRGTLTLAANMVAYAGASENPETTLARDPVTGEVTLGGERYYVVSRVSAASEFSITYMSLGEPLAIQPDSYEYGSGVATLPTPSEAPVGCSFAGWYETADFSGSPVASIAADATGDKTFHAKWNEIPVQESVAYVDGNGEAQNALCTKLTAITERLTNGWYVAADSLTLGTVTVAGTDIHLVIKDGKTLTVTGAGNSAGLLVTNSNAIAIYAQSGGTGALVATGGSGAAGIGGSRYRDGGAVTINGGTVTATGGADGPGIGAGQYYGENGSLTVAPWLVVKAGDSANPSAILAKDANGTVTLNRKRYFTVTQGDSHAITYMDGETELLGLMPTNYVEGMVTTLATTAAKEGFAFAGWYTNATFAGSAVEKITANETGDKTFYAKWYAAEAVSYVDANGGTQTTNGVPLTVDMTNLVSGCYVAKGTLDFGTGGIVIAGDVVLVLADDAVMSVTGGVQKAGIAVPAGRSLTIYGQTAGTGALVAGSGNLSAGIGGDYQMSCGAVTVNGGNVTATGQGGAGIGGGYAGSGGAVTVNGGIVTAETANSLARGIGGGMSASDHGTLVVGPGMVAKGGDESSNLTLLPSVESTGVVIVSQNMRCYKVEKSEEEILPLAQVTGTFDATNGIDTAWTLADTVCYGTKPYSFALKAGSSLPDGFTLEDGVISGAPEASGDYSFTVVVTDSSSPEQQVLEAEYTISASANPNMLTQIVSDLPEALAGFEYYQALGQTIEGGKKPYTFTQKEAMGCYPPSGIKLNGSALSGIPTDPGRITTVTLVVTDANGISTEATYNLNVKSQYVYTFDANDLTWKFIWSENTSRHETRIVLYNDGYQDGRAAVIDDATEGAIVIPSNYGRTSVTCIGDQAFYDCTNLTSVTIPNGITAIGDMAFCGCTNLTSMRIPSSVVQMGYYAFLDSALETVYVDPDTIASVSNLIVATDEDFDASALEFIEVCDVTFNANYDGGGATTNMMRYGQAIGTLPVLAREHYTFDGWFTAAEGGEQISADTQVTQNATYYAHWTIDTFTVTFAKNDGTDAVVESRRVAYGERVGTLPADPTRDGYTFFHWWTEPGNNAGTTASALTTVTADVTYYAHWNPRSYTVRFLKNDGTETVVMNSTKSFGQTLGTLPTPTRDGYTLAGWFTAAEDGEQIDSATLVEGDIDYYAHWEVQSVADWPANTSTVAGKTAGEAFEITGDLANVNAKTLADWAKGAGNVDFADRGDIIPEAFLLNCANTAAAVTTATAIAEEAIKITAITVGENGVPQLTYLATYGNGHVVIQGSATIGSSASWHDGKQTGDHFFKTVLRLQQP